MMSLVDGADADFELSTLNRFAARRRNLQVRYIPAFESDDQRLAMYKQLFQERSPQPDLCEVDVIWPGMIADDLLDLTPYLRDELDAFPAELLKSYTVRGRLIAIPLFLDSGLLYYRSDLLRKYGFTSPPETWDELERMAQTIQRGERHFDPHFWGYVFQGGATEALTCNGLEWQAAEGGGHIIESDGAISVCNPKAIRALARAVSWIGNISPPGVIAYTEDDALNVYRAGHTAFMRGWTSTYGSFRSDPPATRAHTAVALLPAGSSGRASALGGIAIAVSKYSEHRDEAIAALRELVSEPAEIRRILQGGSAPTRLALQKRSDLMQQTLFHGPLLETQLLASLVARPSTAAGSSYDDVSRAYYSAVHSALAKQLPPDIALARLQKELVRITAPRHPR
jgi:trehalose/maltose transport system substrate-binding protein